MSTSGASKIHVLLIAYQCAPDSGSVSMIGWRWVRYLSRICRVTLVTHIRHQEVLQTQLPEGVRAIFIDTEAFAAPLYGAARILFKNSQHVLFMVAGLDFLLFSRKARRMLRKLKPDCRVCHVATPVSPSAPHRLHRIGLPTVLGPLNGGMTTPPGFPEISRREKAWLYPLRGLANMVRNLFGTWKGADVIFSAGSATDRAIGAGAKIRRMCENGVDDIDTQLTPFPANGHLELIFAGRLIAVKGADMLLEAVAGIPPARLTIVGDGPERARLEAMVVRLNMQSQVHFLGHLKQEQLLEHFRRVHLNVLPSIRESGGATILEALSRGRPSLALDYGGPADYIVHGETGFLVPCTNRDQVVHDIRELLKDLTLNPQRLEQMGPACLARAHAYSWETKIAEAESVYRELLGG
ncbi:MAG: glycosyltransferase family 4 protein [Acidobacteriota bacterium]|nr:glycosyltransferase family 4 protein [Acidobacteriota bacterium]